MRPQRRSHQRRSNMARWAIIPIGLVVSIVLAGCTQAQLQGFLPGGPDVTNHTGAIIGLWTTSWIVLLGVGIVTWGLIIWAAVVYRRRKGQTGLPVQLRYNLPIEIFYTIVPLILVLGFFAFTARDQTAIEASYDGKGGTDGADVSIQVFGKRWAWDFNYVTANTYSTGIQAQSLEDEAGVQGAIDADQLPVLYLPVNKKIAIDVESRDVIHSFWVIDFLYKKDMIPGKNTPNMIYFIPLKEGTYPGKCAEMCGEYHSLMLFDVKVVSEKEYEHQMDLLKEAGNVGQLGPEYNTNTNLPGNGANAEGDQ